MNGTNITLVVILAWMILSGCSRTTQVVQQDEAPLFGWFKPKPRPSPSPTPPPYSGPPQSGKIVGQTLSANEVADGTQLTAYLEIHNDGSVALDTYRVSCSMSDPGSMPFSLGSFARTVVAVGDTATIALPITPGRPPGADGSVRDYSMSCVLDPVLGSPSLSQPFSFRVVNRETPAVRDPRMRDEDIVLTRPDPRGRGVFGAITGYEISTGCEFADPRACETPLFRPYDRDTQGWWDNQVEELLFSRVNVAMIHGRGCLDPDEGDEGNGNMCPRLIRNLIPAIDRSGARSAIKLGMFDDTGSYQGARNRVRGYPEGTRFDFADHADALYFFWDLNMKIWFDMVPRDLWYLQEGRPVVAFWTASEYFFQNNQGNSSILLRSLRARFIERYGMDPWFNVDDSWIKLDSTITTNDVQAINGWFGPPQNTGTFRQWAGKTWGAITPSFRDSPTLPGCGAACREVPRGTLGSNFLNYLTQHVTLRSIFTLIEGFTDTVEGNGLYRSDVWDYPSLYLNLVREHADPETRTLRFQAEAADRYSDRDTENRGGQFRDGGLDVGNIDGPDAGWFVGWTDPGEWIQYERIQTGFASYRFTIRYATPLDGQRVRLEIDGRSLGTVTLPRTGDWQKWGYWQLGNRFLLPGKHTIRLVFETGGVNADWFFLKRL